MLAEIDMARGAEPSEQGLTSSIGERCPSSQIHFRQGRAGPLSFGVALEVHTGTVLSRTDTPVALREGKTFEIHVGRLAFHGSPGVFI